MDRQRIVSFFSILAVIILVNNLLLHYLNYKYPIVGHDFSYVLSRMIDFRLHYLVNGLSIQWYTPSFGGGCLPFRIPYRLSLLFTSSYI